MRATALVRDLTVVVLAKCPEPGRVKTRLVPPLTHTQAAALAAAALHDTLEAVAAMPVRRRLLAFDVEPRRWLPGGWRFIPQSRGGLDLRIGAALRSAGSQPAVLVGMDTPQLSSTDLLPFDPAAFDACLGPAADGGYWAIGFRDPRCAPAALAGVPMSTPDTAAAQLAQLRRLGMRVQLLGELVDVDTIASAWAVAQGAPDTRFADLLCAGPSARALMPASAPYERAG